MVSLDIDESIMLDFRDELKKKKKWQDQLFLVKMDLKIVMDIGDWSKLVIYIDIINYYVNIKGGSNHGNK